MNKFKKNFGQESKDIQFLKQKLLDIIQDKSLVLIIILFNELLSALDIG